MDEEQRSPDLGPIPLDPAPKDATPKDQPGANSTGSDRSPEGSIEASATDTTPEHPAGDVREATRGSSRGLSRRDFLRAAAWSTVGLLATQLTGIERAAAAALQNFALPPGLTPSYTGTLRRRDDLLDLKFEFYNFSLFVAFQTGDAVLQRINANQPAYVVVIFPPQATAERAYGVDDIVSAPLLPLEWATAGESRLAFQVPGQVSSIPYTAEALLSWASFTPRLVPAALPAGASPSPYPQIRAPLAHETAIELPWRLMLSPHAGLGWAHATGLVTHNGRTEIWHTRLGQRIGNAIDEWAAPERTVRAVWSRDITNPLHPVLPLSTKSTLSVEDRVNIVRATADGTQGWTPTPVKVNRLMLSPLGGWLDVEGVWTDDHPLLAWRHLATMGRDHYVRVVDKGYLFPYGHAAAQITISERRFENFNGQPGGFLRKEKFIAVRQPLKAYGGPLQPHGGRAWPLRSVRFTTLITPTLNDPDPSIPGVPGAFVVKVGGAPFNFHVAAKDWAGRDSDFMTPVVYVPEAAAFNATHMQSLVDHFNSQDPKGALRRRGMSGQKVALAESQEPGDTTMELDELVLGAVGPAQGATEPQLVGADQPRFFPALSEFGARLSAVEQAGAGDLPPRRFTLGPYITEGFGAGNPGGIFAVLEGQAESATFGADKGGGLITPDFDPRAVSRVLGAVGGDPAEIQQGVFDPADFFKPGAAKLLGGIDLAHIVQKVDNFLTHQEGAMKITTRPIHEDPNDPASPPIAIMTELEWEPDLQSDHPLNLFEPDPGTLRIDAKFRQDLVDPDQSTYEIEGDLRDFKLNLIGGATAFMILRFDRLYFHARSGQKTELKPLVDYVTFAGPLEFVNRIQEYLTFGGSGPYIRPDATGLTAGYDLPLPQVPLGALMLNNIALSASLFIPWSGKPARIRFGLSSREKPFDVTYSAIGGGGFFGIAFGLDGLEKFECALELGAYLSVDFGVVSGSVSISAGIYFAIEKIDHEGEERLTVGLEAYIRFVGKVQALGIVSISLEIYLGLGFQPSPPKLKGIAKAELKVKVLIFKGSVKVTVKRTISATPNDPNFEGLFKPPHWLEYAEAFA